LGRAGGVRAFAALGLIALAGCPEKKPPPAAQDAPDVADAQVGPVNMTALPAASVAAALGADRLPPYNGPTGSVEGTIFVSGDPTPAVQADFSKCPEAEKTYGKLFRDGPPNAAGARPLADAIVGVTGYSGFYIPEKREAKLATLENCAFTQRTIDLTFGQRLDVANKTSILFAPALSGASTPALMVAPPNAEPVHLYPPHAGYFRLSDRLGENPIHADVYVLLHPLHAVTDLNGHYRIDGVPVGAKLTVFARLAKIGETAKEGVEVLSGVVHSVDLTLKYATPKDAGAPTPASVDAGARKSTGPPLK
jgi:hypothetical protein